MSTRCKDVRYMDWFSTAKLEGYPQRNIQMQYSPDPLARVMLRI
jgi:hypothetical protein